MATIELTKDTFESTVMENDIVLVDFWAAWCGPCRSFGPIYEKVSSDYPEIVFAKVDTEAEPELAGYFNIRSIPTLMAFKEQIGVFSQPGALPEPVLTELIGKIEDLDMESVREQIAQEHDHSES